MPAWITCIISSCTAEDQAPEAKGADVENLKQFGALKAIGVTNARLMGMILLQAFSAGALGFAIGTGMAATFFEITRHQLATRGIVLLWQCVALTGASILVVVIVASLLSLRRVLVLEPAAVFRG